jgi:hypothetical protein
MKRTRIARVYFHRAFPKNEPLAPIAVRALALYRDLVVDIEGFSRRPGFETLEGFGPGTRTFHFLRSNVRTLYGVLKLLDAMGGIRRWQEWRGQLPPSARAQWTTAHRALKRMRKDIERVRDTYAAHLEGDFGNIVERLADGYSDSERIEGMDTVDYWPQFAAYFDLVALAEPREFESLQDFRSDIRLRARSFAMASYHDMQLLRIFVHRYGREYPIGLPPTSAWLVRS